MLLTEQSLIYRGIRPLQKLGELTRINPFAGLAMSQRVPDRLRVVPPDPWAGDAQRGRDMIAGTFRFAGQSIERDQLSWQPAGAKPEWLADLHGFEWLRDLRSVGGDRARRMAREMVTYWMEHHEKRPGGQPWQADVTGVRLSAWISFHDFFCASADDDFRHMWFTSLLKQSKHLARSLPGNLSGIPLIRALKGLAYSGLALEDGEERLEQAFRLILREIKVQVLADGGHVSRSPQATFEFLQCLVDLRTALSAARLDMPEELQHAIDRLAPAVKFFRHGDGAFCQFNGGQEGNPNICDATLMHSGARGRAMKSLPYCGYEKIQQGRAALLMDVGLPGLPKYSDRAHAGLLSFEYGFGKDRVIVNCGTSAIAGRWRDLLRATAAHSTLVVDNRNVMQFDDAGQLTTRPEVTVQHHEDDDICMIDAAHTGYVPRYGLTHRRTVRLLDNGEILAGEDHLGGKSGVHFGVRFHLHPFIQASLIKDGEEVLLRARSGIGWRFSAEEATLSIEDSIYAGEGEIPRRALQIVLTGVTTAPQTPVLWRMTREKI
jgi:uncharacterized heparinase superfamily protein